MLRPRALFAYGTLWFPELFEAVTGQRPDSSEAVLADWTALRMKGAVYPGLRRAAGARTDGRVYFDVAAGTWARLDRFEGDLYQLAEVEVEVASGQQLHTAGVYATAEPHLGRLSDEPWDAKRFRDREYPGYLDACRRFAASDGPAILNASEEP